MDKRENIKLHPVHVIPNDTESINIVLAKEHCQDCPKLCEEQEKFLETTKAIYEPAKSPYFKKVRRLNTVAVYFAYAAFGLLGTILGPALVDLRQLLNVDVKQVVLIYPLRGVGGIIGCALGGYIIGRLNYNIILTMSSGLSIVVVILLPWMPNLGSFVSMGFLHGFSTAILNSASNVFLLCLWNGAQNSHSLIQGLHAMYSVGATAGPFILQPFLSETISVRNCIRNASQLLRSVDVQPGSLLNVVKIIESYPVVHGLNSSAALPTMLPRSDLCSNKTNVEQVSRTRVQYGFLTLACISVVVPVLCLIAYRFEKGALLIKQEDTCESQQKFKKWTLKRVMFVLLASLLFGLYVGSEFTTHSLVATLVVDGLHMKRWKGPIITSVFWGAFGVFRILGIFIGRCVSPRTLMAGSISVTCSALLVLVFSMNTHEAVVWVCVAVVGASKGPFFAAGMHLVNEVVTVDGPVSASVTIACAVTVLVFPTLTGFLLETFGHQAMVYFLLANNGALLINFIVISYVISKIQMRKRHQEEINREIFM